MTVDWPGWTERLVPRSAGFVEGGRRLAGGGTRSVPDTPLVTYVTVVRNNAQAVGRAIESVQEQTYPAVEHVVLDGASSDATLEVIRRHAGDLDYFASEPDAGLYDALNKAIPLAHGDLICVLNSDDWLEPDAAERAVAALGETSASALVLSAASVRFDEPGFPVALRWQPAIVHPGSWLTCADDCHNAVYATRSAYERSGCYDASYQIAADFKWLMRCFDAKVDFVYTNDITVNYVLGGASSNAEAHGHECVRALRERFPSLSPAEAGGLYHCLFAFPTFPSVPGRPSDRFAFLRSGLARHADDAELMTAIAWAVVADAELRQTRDQAQEAREPAAVAPTFRDAAKAALERRPVADRIARRLHAAVHRR